MVLAGSIAQPKCNLEPVGAWQKRDGKSKQGGGKLAARRAAFVSIRRGKQAVDQRRSSRFEHVVTGVGSSCWLSSGLVDKGGPRGFWFPLPRIDEGTRISVEVEVEVEVSSNLTLAGSSSFLRLSSTAVWGRIHKSRAHLHLRKRPELEPAISPDQKLGPGGSGPLLMPPKSTSSFFGWCHFDLVSWDPRRCSLGLRWFPSAGPKHTQRARRVP